MISTKEAKHLVGDALNNAGLAYDKLKAKTIEGYVFVKPLGLELPNQKINQVKQQLRGTGAILELPSVVWEGYKIQ